MYPMAAVGEQVAEPGEATKQAHQDQSVVGRPANPVDFGELPESLGTDEAPSGRR